MKRLNRCFRSITTARVARTKAQAPSFPDTCAACATVCIFPAAVNCRVLAPLLTDPPLLPVESGGLAGHREPDFLAVSTIRPLSSARGCGLRQPLEPAEWVTHVENHRSFLPTAHHLPSTTTSGRCSTQLLGPPSLTRGSSSALLGFPASPFAAFSGGLRIHQNPQKKSCNLGRDECQLSSGTRLIRLTSTECAPLVEYPRARDLEI